MNREELRRELVRLREGRGAIEAKFVNAEVLKSALGAATAADARGQLQQRVAKQRGDMWDALRNAYDFDQAGPDTTTRRRERFRETHHISHDTIKRWEAKALDALVDLLLEGDSGSAEPIGGLGHFSKGPWAAHFNGVGCYWVWQETFLQWHAYGRRPGTATLRCESRNGEAAILGLRFEQPNEPGSLVDLSWSAKDQPFDLVFEFQDVHYPPFVHLTVDGQDVRVPDVLSFKVQLDGFTEVGLNWWWHGQKAS